MSEEAWQDEEDRLQDEEEREYWESKRIDEWEFFDEDLAAWNALDSDPSPEG